MNLRLLLPLIGACFLAAGPILMHHVDSTAIYLTGEILAALGPVLISYRFVTSDPPVSKLPDPQAFRHPLGQPQKP